MTDTPLQIREREAREVLASELDSAGFPGHAHVIRKWTTATASEKAAIRAMLAYADAAVDAERERAQAEGFAAAVQWLRDRSATKPRATLYHAASMLADQLEQSRQPCAAIRNPEGGS